MPPPHRAILLGGMRVGGLLTKGFDVVDVWPLVSKEERYNRGSSA